LPAPIGIFDSGVGGISILSEIRKQLPNENLLYFADSGYCPYGTKPLEKIRERTLKITHFLVSKNAKAVVVACNAACTAGLEQIRDHHPQLPVIGVEPAVKPACELTRNGKIGVLSTNMTIEGTRFSHLVASYGNGVEIFTQPAPGLADLVEAGKIDAQETKELLNRYLQPLLARGIDTLILGCTHYPFLRPIIREICGDGVILLDTGAAVAKQTEKVLIQKRLIESKNNLGSISFFTSGEPDFVKKVLEKLWPEKIDEVFKAEI
jgi:glutamate racemase